MIQFLLQRFLRTLLDSQFLYLQDLTESDPYGVFPLLVTVLMLLQQKLMPMGTMDPAQQKIMRLMPLMQS